MYARRYMVYSFILYIYFLLPEWNTNRLPYKIIIPFIILSEISLVFLKFLISLLQISVLSCFLSMDWVELLEEMGYSSL